MPGIPGYVTAGEGLEPGAGGGVTAVSKLQVITVPVQGVAQVRSPGVLDGRPGRDHLLESVFLHRPAGGVHDGRIHDLLVPSIHGKLRMGRIGTVGPGLVPDQPDAFPRTGLDESDQFLQVRLEGLVEAGNATRLLQAHHVPRLIGQSHFERISRHIGPDTVNNLAVPVIGDVPETVVIMPLQRAATDVQIPDDDRNPFRIKEFPKVLFDGVLGETVSDGQDPERVPLGGPSRQTDGQKQKDGNFFHGVWSFGHEIYK